LKIKQRPSEFYTICNGFNLMIFDGLSNDNTTPKKGLLRWLFPPVSSDFKTTVIGSAAKFNSGFVEKRCKPFTAVLIEQPL
jgi:hypothetical protein